MVSGGEQREPKTTGCKPGRFLVRLAWFGVVWVSSVAGAQAQLAPEQSLSKLRPAEGIRVELFAAEPMVENPAAIDVDTQGRVWVAEITRYRKFAEEPPADRIKVLEDTDGDGRADRVTVFAEGVYCPMSICVAGSRVLVATSPDLWLYEDRDGDLRADGPPTKLLTGFGGFNHDHGAHSLVLGPDHKWWMSHGDGGFDVTGPDGSGARFRWGGVLRGELDGTQLELVCQNFRNPYEVAISSLGEAYLSDNDNDGNQSARICWLLDGGDYGWFGGPPGRVAPEIPYAEGWHFRAHLPGFVPGTLVTGFGSPAGMCFYEGDAFGPQRRNQPWHCDPGPREVRMYPHEPRGYGRRAEIRTALTVSGDDFVRPVDICAAPDGTLLVADWYDGGVGGHAYNNPNQGRIYRLVPAAGRPKRREPPGPYANVETAALALGSPNLATQFLAREALLSQAEAAAGALAPLVEADDTNERARALWVLDRLGPPHREAVVKTLSHPDETLRALAVRILRRHGTEYLEQLAALAPDGSLEVRRELLLAMRHWPAARAVPLWLRLAQSYDGTDRYQLEALNLAAADRRQEFFAALTAGGELGPRQIALGQLLDAGQTTALLAGRLADPARDAAEKRTYLLALASEPGDDAAKAVFALASDATARGELRRLAMELLATNLSGIWRSFGDRTELAAALPQWVAVPDLQAQAIALAVAAGSTELVQPLAALAESAQARPEIRAAALGALASLAASDEAARVARLVADPAPEVRQAALKALSTLQTWGPVGELLASPGLPAQVREAVFDELISTTAGSLWLLRSWPPPHLDGAGQRRVLERAARHPDAHVRGLFERFLPEGDRPRRLGAEFSAAQLLAQTGDPARGEQIFFESTAAQCHQCHRVRGRGGALGPDLSQVGRKYERAALLETILDPSRAMAPEYVPHLAETERGQVYLGFVVDRDETHVTLRDAQGLAVRLPLSDVVALDPQPKSLMPELVLRDVTAQDAADLLAFLSSLREAVQPVVRWRIAGPFDNGRQSGLAASFVAELNPGQPDFAAELTGLAGPPGHWELVAAEPLEQVWAVDTVAWDQAHGIRGDRVTHYFFTWIESPAEQPARLGLRSDDGVKLWHDGALVHENDTQRALLSQRDEIPLVLRTGRNALLIKVENRSGPGGLSLEIETEQGVQLRTE